MRPYRNAFILQVIEEIRDARIKYLIYSVDVGEIYDKIELMELTESQ